MGIPYTAVGAAGAGISIKVNSKSGMRVKITGLNASLSVAPAAPVPITVQEGSGLTTRLQLDLVGAGPQNLYPPDGGWLFEVGQDVTVAVAAPGGAVVPKLNVTAEWKPVQEGEE